MDHHGMDRRYDIWYIVANHTNERTTFGTNNEIINHESTYALSL